MKRSIYDWILEISALVALAWSFYPLYYYREITYVLPLHYEALGEPAVWDKPSFFWLLPLFSLATYIGVSVLQRHYKKLNYPVKVTKENAEQLYRLNLRLLQYIKLITILLFAYINYHTFSAAISYGKGVNVYIVALLVVGLIGVIICYIIKMVRIDSK